MNGRRLLTAGLVSTLEHDKKIVEGVLYQSARPAAGLVKFGHRLMFDRLIFRAGGMAWAREF